MEPGSIITGNNFQTVNKNAIRKINMHISNHNTFNFYEFSAVLIGLVVSKKVQVVSEGWLKTTSEFIVRLAKPWPYF